MWASWPVLLLVFGSAAFAQRPCDGTPMYSPCEMTFDLTPADLASHPNPFATVDLNVEFRSPLFKTYLMPGFWDGGNKIIVRFTPTKAGAWTFKTTSNIPSLNGREGGFNAVDSNAPGFVIIANVHHWATDRNEATGNQHPHLWMGYIADRFAFESAADFERGLTTAVDNKFTHIRGSILGGMADRERVCLGPDRPNLAYFGELDRRIAEIHKRGLTTDLMLGANPDVITSIFSDAHSRDRFIRYVVARYAAFNITWQGLGEFEDYSNGRSLLKELGLDLKRLDPYHHPRSTNSKVTSSPLLADGWMNYVIEGSTNDSVGSIEHQFYPVPFVGVTDAAHLWNSTMDGEYPEFHGPNPNAAKVWFNFMSGARHWELEPYFDVSDARAVALVDVEYLSYIQHPGPPVEITVENHGYDVQWLDPATGQMVDEKKYKGQHFTGQAPDSSHPWVLNIARQAHMEGMLKSYKFASQPVPVQVVETNVAKLPFTITAPEGSSITASVPTQFSVKLTRENRSTRSMMYLWTGEAVADSLGFRVLGTGSPGTFIIPASLAANLPAVLAIHVSALNAYGKAYSTDRVYQLTK